MTHGEEYLIRRNKLDLSLDLDQITRSFQHLPQRMSRADATRYYNNKAREVFKSLGYEYKERVKAIEDFEERMNVTLRAVRRHTNSMIRVEAKKNRELLGMVA